MEAPRHAHRLPRPRWRTAAVLLVGAMGFAASALAQPAAEGPPAPLADSLLTSAERAAEARDFPEAERLTREALGVLEAAHGPDHPEVLAAWSDLGWLLVDLGRLDEAKAAFERVLEGREATLAPDDVAVAAALTDLGTVLYYRGQYDRARTYNARAVAILEAAQGTDPEADPMDLAYALNGQALLAFTEGSFTEARGLYERVLAITERERGGDHYEVAIVLSNLAPVVHQLGDYAGARPLYERALAIDTALQDSLAMGIDLDRLGYLLADQGDLVAAREHYKQALQLKEAVVGPDDARLSGTLHNLAGVLVRQGEQVEGRALYERAHAVSARFAPDHPEVARNLRRLGLLDLEAGAWDEAQGRLTQALAIQRSRLGADHPNVAETLADLGLLALETEDLAAADALYRQALSVWEGALGPDHPSLVRGLNGLALMAERRGTEAREPLLRAGRLVSRYAEGVLPALAFAEQQALLNTVLPRQTALLLSALDEGEGLAEAYTFVAGWKGLLLHELRRQGAVTQLSADPVYAERVRRLHTLRTDLAALYRPGGQGVASLRARADSLTSEKERLERVLLGALPPGALADPWQLHGLAGLQGALPLTTAFVDVYRRGHHEAGKPGATRYSAVVTTRDAGPTLVHLGEADSLDALAAVWLTDTVEGAREVDPAERLAGALWGRIAALLPAGTERVWVSPDGALAGVPWAALAAEHEATSDLLVTQVPSARALLALLTPPPEASGEPSLLLVGDVDFGEGGGWAPLPGTAAEVNALEALAVAEGLTPTVLTGAAPTAAAVSSALPRATYAHLATHGFFYGESEAAYAARGGEGSLSRTEVLGVATPALGENRNPLVESGLAFVGASTPEVTPGGGTITAEELIGIDLSGTRLVTLSACDTGRGREVTGQGVLGLQASFTAAGARSLLMSLWKVPDASTAALMEHFYRGLWERGLSSAEALRRAQEAVRATSGWEAPVHWAAWVLTGEAW